MNCIICNIINKTETSYIIVENDTSIAFLDVRPLFHGHCLVAPREHIQTLYDLSQSLIEPYFATVQKVGLAVQNSMNAEGSFIAMNNIVSQSIPHLHTHIVPRLKGDGLKGFFWPRTKYNDAKHMEEIRKKIIAELKGK